MKPININNATVDYIAENIIQLYDSQEYPGYVKSVTRDTVYTNVVIYSAVFELDGEKLFMQQTVYTRPSATGTFDVTAKRTEVFK